MKRPRPRITVRRLMIAVMIVGLSIRAYTWVVEMRSRSAAYYRRGQEFAWSTMRSGSRVLMTDGRWVDRYDNENRRQEDAWALEMAEKYWRLSDYPWLPVEPDPPCPQPLADPKTAFELPPRTVVGLDHRGPRPPAWTFLWTWHRRE